MSPLLIRPQAERLIKERAANLAEEQLVFDAFCNAFDATAKKLPSGYAYRIAKDFASTFIAAWSQTFAGTTANNSSASSKPPNKQPRSYASALNNSIFAPSSQQN